MSLFVPEDEEYDDKRMESPVPEDLPPAEISVERTQALYLRLPEDQSTLIPVVVSDKNTFVPIYESKEISCNLPLRFYQEIVETMLAKDGLLILGRGLGCIMVTANLLYALSSTSVLLEEGNVVTKKRSLVILLNAREEEIVQINDALMELRWLNSVVESLDITDEEWELPLRVVAGSDLANTKRRRALYERGGVLFVSSRVLIVDILSGIIEPNDITGIVVLHTERVKETSNESFIVNLYRDSNDWGFVKAISDEPELFTGFTPLASTLRILRISNVFLWPRFHVEVSSLLLKASGLQRTTVTEINVRLSHKMKKIQSAILSCLQACLQELKRHNPTLDSEYWDVENIHDTDFIRRVRGPLESQWHRISWTSKQLVYDLHTLKRLLSGLLTMDSLCFYQEVQGVVDANMKNSSTAAGTMGTTTMSPWLMMDEATTIISYAKERALGKVTVALTHVNLETNEEATTAGDEVYNLEELPKWEQLAIVIDDILHERSIDKTEGPVLIMCSKEETARQLSSVLTRMRKKENLGRKHFSSRNYMVSQLQDYILWKEVTSLTKLLVLEMGKDGEQNSPTPDEELNTSKSFTRGSNAPQSKRRRTRGSAAVANVARLYSGTNFEKTAGAIELEDSILERVEQQLKAESDDDEVREDESLFVGDVQDFTSEGSWEHIDKFDQIVIETYNDNTNEFLLQELSPSYVIMYEPDLAFIRRVEVFQALNPLAPAKTFFMYYGTSVEEQAHLMKIRKEKQAFTRLIKEKATLSKHYATESDNWKFHIRKPQVVNTRIAGGASFRTDADEMRVIVDTREFSSSLGNLLYRVGIKVIPCMLTVGDYILSPRICVERKAIPDLISSFKSGRLYQQCEQMFRHYELPTLLIEFDENKSFSFEPFAEMRAPGQKVNASNPIGSKILKREIQLKIAELLISFPKLKVIWSSSPYESAQIILELKASQQEPDVEEALAKGVNPTITTREGPPMMNDDAIDILQTIPGINNVNYTTVILKVRSLQDLVTLTQEQFAELLGVESGNKAYNFINRTVG